MGLLDLAVAGEHRSRAVAREFQREHPAPWSGALGREVWSWPISALIRCTTLVSVPPSRAVLNALSVSQVVDVFRALITAAVAQANARR